jgi:phage I-like protein
VHNPNLHLTALASQDSAMQPTEPAPKEAPDAQLGAAIAKMLGLPEGTPPADLLAKLTAALQAPPDPAKFMPVAAVQSLLQDRNLERATASQERATAKVEKALQDCYITPGLKDWALALCRSDEAAFDAFLEKSGVSFAYLFKETHARNVAPSTTQPIGQTETAAAICAQLGLKPGTLND